MHFHVITLFPEMFSALQCGITGRAQTHNLIHIDLWNPRDFTDHPDRRVDDRPFGGGPGMVMQYLPLHNAVTAAKSACIDQNNTKVIYLSPQGKPLTQSIVAQFASNSAQSLIFIAGRYEGIDERLFQTDIDEEYSIGDYVLSGGEIPIMVMIDAITRLLPNALGDAESAKQDSFSDGLLDHPHYTRPADINGLSVPKVLQSGDHKAIEHWRRKESIGNTWQKRPDLIKRRILSAEEEHLLQMTIEETTNVSNRGKEHEHSHPSD